jgi:hypothetical protein
MQGGFYESNNFGGGDNRDNQSTQKARDKGGLVPVTCKILNDATISKDESVEYQGVTISDIMIVGYILNYNELDSKVKITLWDHTGKVEVTFYFSDSEGHSGLANFHFSE